MAKKLSKNTSIAKAKSLKTNVTRKFKGGGPSNFNVQDLIDPEKPVGGPAKDQFFPKYYEANKPAFDAADTQARGMGTDWYSKRRELPQFTNTSDVFLKTFKEGAPAYYFPDEAYDNTSLLGGRSDDSDASAFTNTSQIEPGKTPNPAETIMHNNPYATPKYEANWTKTVNEEGKDDNLNANSVYYRGMQGARPYVAYEELNHIASGIANHIPETNHAEGMQVLKNTITPKSIRKMGYGDVNRGLAKYYADEEEYLTSLNTARTSFGLDATKDYTEDEIYNILEQGRATGAAGGYNKENAQEEQMSRFYRAIGYPTGNSKFLNGKKPEDLNDEERAKYEQAKRDAAKRFLTTHNAVAENEGGNTEDYGLPQAARYGGYQTYKTGGVNKKKKPANDTYPPNYSVPNPTIIYHTDPREFQIASGAEADSSFAHQNTQNFVNFLKVNPQAINTATAKPMAKLVSEQMLEEYIKKGVTGYPSAGKRQYPKNSATGKDIKPVNVGLVWPSKTPGEVYVQGNWNKDSSGVKGQDNLRKNTLPISAGYYTGYYPAPKQHHVLETAGEPMEPIGMKPIESSTPPVTIQQQFPEESYTLHQTGNGGGVAYVHKTIRDKNGNVVKQELVGSTLTRDWMTPEEEDEFFSAKGGSKSVQYNPKAKIYSNVQEPLQIVESERGLKEKSDVSLQKEVTQVEAEKTAYEQYQQQLRDKEKARLKKTQDEIEAEKAENKKAMGGFGDPEDPEKPWRHKIKSKDGNYLYNRVGTNAIQDYDKSTVRRTLKGFITGAPKPKETIPRTSDAKFAKGGMNKNMLNANSTTGPRSEQSWQDPGVNRFSGNTNGVNADYYFKKGGLKSKVSSKFAKLKL
jgi:hypothetical protein